MTVEALSQTEIAYACQEAMGGPYRPPIFQLKPSTPTTPKLIAALLRQWKPVIGLSGPPALIWETRTLTSLWARHAAR